MLQIDNTTPTVSFIIRTKNEATKIAACLTGICAQVCEGVSAEIIIIDSGSSDNTLAICAAFPTQIYTIPAASFNYARALNQGAQLAKGRYTIAFTAHAQPTDNQWLTRLLAPFHNAEKVTATFSREIAWPDANPLEAARLNDRFPASNGTPTFSNVASCVRRDQLIAHPFPEMAYAEDQAWAQQMLLAGWLITYVPKATVYHSHNDSLVAAYRRQRNIGRSKRNSPHGIIRPALSAWRSQLHFLRQHYSLYNQLRWSALGLLYCAVRIVAQTQGRYA